MVGHAVRGMYMASAMADLAFELNDESLKRACEALWRDVTTAQMYVTGGLGPDASNEGFTEPYDLPNETAYAETCASVALVFWAQRMLHLDLDGRYADVMELALFNGALTGLSREGTHYFYANPLESRGQHRRWAWHALPLLHDERCAPRRLGRGLRAVEERQRASPFTSTAASRRRRRSAASGSRCGRGATTRGAATSPSRSTRRRRSPST